MLTNPTWQSLDGPYTRGWWALQAGTERLALVQPFDDRALVIFYLGNQPWNQRRESAASIQQGRRFAERWLAPRLAAMAS